LEFYTEDAQVLPPLTQPIVGRSVIEKDLRQQAKELADQPVNPEIETSNLEVAGDLAIETGRSTIKVGNLPPVKGHYLVVWKKTQGQWKIHREMGNFSTSHEEGFLRITPGDRLETPGEK
jgi:ketosteroid isomerase-like protein